MSDFFEAGCAWIDGHYVPLSTACIPLGDAGFRRGDAVYDGVTTWRGNFFRLADHLNRFERNCFCLQLVPPIAFAEISIILGECVRRSGLEYAYVEMICTRGTMSSALRDLRIAVNCFYAFAAPYDGIAAVDALESGISLIIAGQVERISTRGIDPTVKSFQWRDFTCAQFEALERDAHTAVLLDSAGHLTEGPGFNLFVYSRGTLLTPGEGILPGITRQTVLELAALEHIAARVTRFGAETLYDADEVFLTSTAGGIVPVMSVDGRLIGDGTPGPMTRRLHARYWGAHRQGAWVTPVHETVTGGRRNP